MIQSDDLLQYNSWPFINDVRKTFHPDAFMEKNKHQPMDFTKTNNPNRLMIYMHFTNTYE